MEHIIQEHTLEYPPACKDEVVLHCMSCDDWVSLKDTSEVVEEFKNTPCSGPRQHDNEDEILPTTSGVPTVDAEQQTELCIRCQEPLLGNCTQVESDTYPLFKCLNCGTVNFWD